MTFLEERDLEDVPTIPEYYKGKTIFITGGSGFMGKVLIEKLLYSCSELDRIYLLLRQKRGVKPEDRLASLYKSQCFDRLRSEKPNIFKSKVFFIAGNVTEIGLGILEDDRALLINRTNIIFHCAASVRFDDSLKVAMQMNVRSTLEMLKLAEEVRNLESFVHLSTSYSNTNRDPVEEIMYPPLADWKNTLQICDEIDDSILKPLTEKYIGEMPNTYSFTKQLAEHVVYHYQGKLPLVLIRPSIVVSSVYEPMPGWIDNFNGPVGMMIARSKGLLRTQYINPDISADLIPVDVSIKCIISASWIRGTKKLESTDDVAIYNSSVNDLFRFTNGCLAEMGKKLVPQMPLKGTIWPITTRMTSSLFLYHVQVFAYHLLPALLIDMLFWLLGKRTILVKLHRRIYIAMLAVSYYLVQQWTFNNKNFLQLRSKIKEADKKAFYYDLENVIKDDYVAKVLSASNKFLLHETDDNLKENQAHYRRLKAIEKTVNFVFYGLLFWWLTKTAFIKNLFTNFLN